jgi:hypothetical protein
VHKVRVNVRKWGPKTPFSNNFSKITILSLQQSLNKPKKEKSYDNTLQRVTSRTTTSEALFRT